MSEYLRALEWVEDNWPKASYLKGMLLSEKLQTIRRALLIAHKLTGEPSQAVYDAGEITFVSSYTGTPTSTPSRVFKAMAAQLINEVEKDMK